MPHRHPTPVDPIARPWERFIRRDYPAQAHPTSGCLTRAHWDGWALNPMNYTLEAPGPWLPPGTRTGGFGGPYYLDLERCLTDAAVLDSLDHIGGKRPYADSVSGLAAAVEELLGFAAQIYGGPGAAPRRPAEIRRQIDAWVAAYWTPAPPDLC